ncbi:MAG: hypothetical protein AUJ72_03760 [Candidatus Omnitrophica bacterium CG1_02_46_14]|nr:MAG: hypothetical protein AUJ72_03760 [Candidatus Omnitrophica bacterium CG1_02_46_14]
MTILAATLIGLCIGCVTWLLVTHGQSRRLIAHRISEVSGGAGNITTNSLDSVLRDMKNKSSQISFENSMRDKITHDLFVAGIHSPNTVRIFHSLIKLSAAMPALLAVFFALTGSLTLKSAFFSGVAGLVLYIYIHLLIRAAKQKRQNVIMRSLPQVLDLLVVCVEAGLSFSAAVERILKELDPNNALVKELKIMHSEFLGGLSLEKACERLDKRCEVTDLSLLLTSIVQSDQMGSSLGSTLRTQAIEMRDKYKQRIRAKALQIPVKILFPMVPIFLAFMLLNLAIVGFQLGAVMQTGNMTKIGVKTARK